MSENEANFAKLKAERRQRREADERKAMLDELAGTKCQCGARKKAKMTVCFNCWQKIPDRLQWRLYKKFGEGYEEAYREAMDVLNAEE